MAANFNAYNSINRPAALQCASNLVLPILDAAIILVVSLLVCLRISVLGT